MEPLAYLIHHLSYDVLLLLAAIGLSSWRAAHMLVHEPGPFEMFALLRERTGIGADIEGNAVTWPLWNPLWCVYCTSVYTTIVMAALIALGGIMGLVIVYLLALCALPCLIEAWHDK